MTPQALDGLDARRFRQRRLALAHELMPLANCTGFSCKHRSPLPRPLHLRSRKILSAAAKASADMVRVGLEVPMVGMLPQPTRKRLSWSHARWSRLTTESEALKPMRCVPTRWPAP